MDRNARFFAGGLAAAAVASAVTLATPTAYAGAGTDRPCGQPAVPATYLTQVSEPVLRTVAAVTHDEWRWERQVTTDEQEYSRVVSPARTETDWVRAGTTEYQWSRTVVDREGVAEVPGTSERGHVESVVVTPAVTVTRYEYVQQQTGRTRWEDAGWNGEHDGDDDGKGWTRTGATREDVVSEAVTEQVWVVDEPATPGSPAVPELSHVEYSWSATSPGADWTGPLASRVTGGGETATTTDGGTPAGTGWTATATRDVPAVVETLWAETAPDGYTATGASRVKDISTEQTTETSALAPEGDGWTTVSESRVVVVDQPETTEVASPGSTQQVLVTPAEPATEECPVVASQVVSATASPSHQSDHVHAHQAAAPNAVTVLPAAGNPVSPLLLTAGIGGVLAGSVLVGIGRRRRTS